MNLARPRRLLIGADVLSYAALAGLGVVAVVQGEVDGSGPLAPSQLPPFSGSS